MPDWCSRFDQGGSEVRQFRRSKMTRVLTAPWFMSYWTFLDLLVATVKQWQGTFLHRYVLLVVSGQSSPSKAYYSALDHVNPIEV